jgi:hypothetical protein
MSELSKKAVFFIIVVGMFVMAAGIVLAQNPIHVTYLWHMHQPIYYPGLTVTETDNAGSFSFNVRNIFDTRTGPYTTWPKDAVQQGADRNMPHAGVQVSFSGSLMENLNGIWSPSWRDSYQAGRNQLLTANGNPRLDLVGFSYFHSLMPLTSRESMKMQIRLHREAYIDNWNTGGGYSKGFFPPESSFETRMIPALVSEGIEWVLVDNGHIDRTLADFPWSSASSVRPNRADQRNGVVANWNSQWTSLQNIWAPTPVAAPFSYQPRRIRYVDPWSDPSNPTVYSMIAVPAGRYEGNESGRGGYGAFKPENVWGPVADRNNNPNRPMIIVCHSDGDNYGMLNSDAYHAQFGYFLDMCQNNASFDNTTVQDYLELYPVPANDPYIHVESGSWIGVDGGTPYYYKWLENNAVNGVHPDYWSWSVLISALNRVLQADNLETNYSIADVRFGTGPDTAKAWRSYLNAEASDYWYWDFAADPWDGNVTRAANTAITEANKVIARHPGVDNIGPSIFHPQRSSWNPGGKLYDEASNQPSDFDVWTFVDDVSGVQNVRLYWRIANWDWYTNMNDFAQEIYAHTPGKNSDWNIVPMTGTTYPPVKEASVPDPLARAQLYTGSITGQTQNLISYFVEAVDTVGNTNRSDIFHVWVGSATAGGGNVVTVSPNPPVTGDPVTIQYNAVGRNIASANPVKIHLGWNNWATVVSPDASMTFNSANSLWEYTVTVPANATQLDCVFNNGAGTWDNNNGADWHFAVTSGPPQVPQPPTNVTAVAMSTNQINVSWSSSSGAAGYVVYRDGTQVGMPSTTTFNDLGLLANTQYCYTIAASNSVCVSSQSSPSVCATTLTNSVPSAPPTPATVTATAVATNQINVTWSSSSGAISYIVARGGNPITNVSTTSYLDSGLLANSPYCYTVAATNSAGASAFSSSACATTLAAPPPAFVLNGSVSNYPGYLLMAPGMTLYAAVRGRTLYVATWSPGTYAGSNSLNDHFVLVSTQVLSSATSSAPWGKPGTVAVPTTTVMLCGESTTTYVGWQYLTGTTVTSASNQFMKASTNAGQMQGTIDLIQAFGSMPTTLYLCAAAYNTTDGGPLAGQAPAGNGNGNIESNEFLAIPVASIVDSDGDGVLDYLDPSKGFHVQGTQPSGPDGSIITWVSVPGKSYDVMYCDSLGAGWTNLPNAQVTAGSGQTLLSYTDNSATDTVQRFYKVHSSY